MVAECRWQSFVVFGVSGSLEITASHWRSFSVVDSLSSSLVVFQSLHLNCYFWRQTYSLPVVDGLSGSLAVAKVILICFHMTKMKRQGLWQSFMVVNGHWDRPRVYLSDPVVVFEGRYWCLQKLHSCFHIVVDSFWRNFKFSNDRKRPLVSVWKPGSSQWPLMTLKDCQWPCRFICVIWKHNKITLATVNDPERPPMTCSE